jgi:hypothetical protein
MRELDERLGFGELIEQPAAAGPTRAVGRIHSFPSPTIKEGKQAVKMTRPAWRDAIGSDATKCGSGCA